MVSSHYFNIRFLCVVSILSVSCAHTGYAYNMNPIWYAAQASASTTETPKPTQMPTLTHVPFDRTNGAVIEQATEINSNLKAIHKTLVKQKRRGRFTALITAAFLLETAYIVNDKNPFGIATSIKERCATWWDDVLESLSKRKQSVDEHPSDKSSIQQQSSGDQSNDINKRDSSSSTNP